MTCQHAAVVSAGTNLARCASSLDYSSTTSATQQINCLSLPIATCFWIVVGSSVVLRSQQLILLPNPASWTLYEHYRLPLPCWVNPALFSLSTPEPTQNPTCGVKQGWALQHQQQSSAPAAGTLRAAIRGICLRARHLVSSQAFILRILTSSILSKKRWRRRNHHKMLSGPSSIPGRVRHILHGLFQLLCLLYGVHGNLQKT